MSGVVADEHVRAVLDGFEVGAVAAGGEVAVGGEFAIGKGADGCAVFALAPENKSLILSA